MIVREWKYVGIILHLDEVEWLKALEVGAIVSLVHGIKSFLHLRVEARGASKYSNPTPARGFWLCDAFLAWWCPRFALRIFKTRR